MLKPEEAQPIYCSTVRCNLSSGIMVLFNTYLVPGTSYDTWIAMRKRIRGQRCSRRYPLCAQLSPIVLCLMVGLDASASSASYDVVVVVVVAVFLLMFSR